MQKTMTQNTPPISENRDLFKGRQIQQEDKAVSRLRRSQGVQLPGRDHKDIPRCAYITHRRIKIAEGLLEQPNLSITEVSLQSG